MREYITGAEILPGWKVVRMIGGGGFGKVYEAEKQDENGGHFSSAIKAISIPQTNDEYEAYIDDGYDEESVTSILRSQVDNIVSEFRFMSQFKGVTNIVSCEDHAIVEHEDGHGWDVFIRMELLTSLTEQLKKNNLSEKEVVQLGVDICTALELCAKKNVIHRDIKPQNIFINEFGNYKLGDFGIAKTMDHATHATRIGTTNYMAPEVYLDKPYDARIDQYSLGLMMYWLLNERRLPFLPLPPAVETVSQRNEAMERRLKGEAIPRPLHGSDELVAVVLKACAYEPSDRYDNPTQMKHALFAAMTAAKNDAVTFGLTNKHQVSEAEEKTEALISEVTEENDDKTEYMLPDEDDPDKTESLLTTLPEEENNAEALPPVKNTRSITKGKNKKSKLIIGVIAGLAAIIVLILLLFKFCSASGSHVTSISVKSKPDKTEYFIGDTLDTSGLSLTVTNDDGSSETLISGFTCSPTTLSGAGKQTITVSYSGRSATFSVYVFEVQVATVSLNKMPDKTDYYTGETLDTSGLVLNVFYTNGTTSTQSSGFSCSPTYFDSEGSQNITVSYEGYQWFSFCVNVEKINLKFNGDISGLTVVSLLENNVNSVTIPSSYDGRAVTAIGLGAFCDCDDLTCVTISDSVKSIGDYAFAGCSNLTSVTIPVGVKTIGANVFRECFGLTSINIPNTVTSIGEGAFWGCTGLTDITIPNGVSNIDNYAFYQCEGLTDITIPNSVTNIGEGAFWGCTGLKGISIPNSVTSIGGGAFWECTGLTSVTVPNGVTSIEKYAFYQCNSLTSINIPNSVTSIGEGAFSYCSGLKSIKFNGTVAQWNNITKGIYWKEVTGDFNVYCSDGILSK